MANIYLTNAFSLQMVTPADGLGWKMLHFNEMSVDEVQEYLQGGFISAIGHADTARVVSGILGVDAPMNRVSITLNQGDVLIVAQITGGRLPEGATTLPEGASIRFIKVYEANDAEYQAVSSS